MQGSRDDARLHLGDQVVLVDAQDAVQAGKHQCDPPLDRYAAAGKAAARAPRVDGDFFRIGHFKNQADLRCVRRFDDHIGIKLLLGGIVGITDAIGLLGRNVFFADNILQYVYKAFFQHGLQRVLR